MLQLETSDLINPNDDPATFEFQTADGSVDTLVVGHLPFMAKLVSQLVIGDDNHRLAACRPGSLLDPAADSS